MELDPLAELDAALTRYISRYGYYRLNRRDSRHTSYHHTDNSTISGDEIGPERQRSAIAILASLKSRDHLSVKGTPIAEACSYRHVGPAVFDATV